MCSIINLKLFSISKRLYSPRNYEYRRGISEVRNAAILHAQCYYPHYLQL